MMVILNDQNRKRLRYGDYETGQMTFSDLVSLNNMHVYDLNAKRFRCPPNDNNAQSRSYLVVD